MNSTSSETATKVASPIKIDLLGTVFSIQTDESPEYMDNLVSELRIRMSRLSVATRVTDPLKLSILAGIVLLDELRHAKTSETEAGATENEGDKAASSLLASLDRRLFEAGL